MYIERCSWAEDYTCGKHEQRLYQETVAWAVQPWVSRGRQKKSPLLNETVTPGLKAHAQAQLEGVG